MDAELLERLRAINATSAFNRWAGFEVIGAGAGEAVIEASWREEFGQYSGFMHAGLVGAMIDTVAGFAAATLAGAVLASQYQVTCYAPAVGERFRAVGRVAKAGKRQVFANAELFARQGAKEKLVAGGSAVLITAA